MTWVDTRVRSGDEEGVGKERERGGEGGREREEGKEGGRERERG